MTQETTSSPAQPGSVSRSTSTTLDPDAKYLIVINTYIVEPQRAEEILDMLTRSTEEVLRFVDGFVSANLHVSEDRTQVVNYSQWKSVELLEAAGKNRNVQERMKAVGQIANSFQPVRYELRTCLPAAMLS